MPIVSLRRLSFWFIVTAVAASLATPVFTAEPSQPASQQHAAEQLFLSKIRPLFAEKCLACHGAKPDEIKSSFDLRSQESALRGGESGDTAIVPGKPEESLLYQAVRWDGIEMPPKKNDRLTSEQVELIRQWIAAGAPWPDDAHKIPNASSTAGQSWSDTDGIVVKTSGGMSPEWTNRRYKPENIWAYQPIKH